MRYFIILTFFLFSCGDGAQTLPSSTGTNSEVIFVVADVKPMFVIESIVGLGELIVNGPTHTF